MATPLQPTQKQMVIEHRPWLATVLENLAAGAGVGALIWAGLQPEMQPHYRAGVMVAGGLCAVRFGIDEVALLCEVIAESFAAAFAGVRNRFDGGALRAEIHRLQAANQKQQQRIAELTAQATKPQRPQPSAQPATTFGPADVARWEERQQEFQQQLNGWTGEDAPEAEPAVNHPAQLDGSILSLVDDANALLDHYERHGNLSKPSAEKSKIYARQWKRATDFLADAGAIQKGANGYELVGSVADAQCAIDEYLDRLHATLGK